jgi:TDG/mug DNA glycosylase family protein
VGFTRSQLESYRGGTLPDLIGPSVRLLFVGINPGLWTVATQSHFGRRGNRFYPALYRAGITDRVIDASAGFVAADVAHLIQRGVGITNLFAEATARADEIDPAGLVAGADELRRRVDRINPAVVAILGVTAYRIAFGERRAGVGKQARDFGRSQVWVLPNPSGLNAHETVTTLASAYRKAAIAAGVAVFPSPAPDG